jgi:hypothetical protein
MTVQTSRRPDTETHAEQRRASLPRRVVWLLALLVAMAVAAVVGVAVAAHLTSPATVAPTVYHEPNANTREGRVPAPTFTEPNASTREGRVPAPTYVEPNANTREGRDPTTR